MTDWHETNKQQSKQANKQTSQNTILDLMLAHGATQVIFKLEEMQSFLSMQETWNSAGNELYYIYYSGLSREVELQFSLQQKCP